MAKAQHLQQASLPELSQVNQHTVITGTMRLQRYHFAIFLLNQYRISTEIFNRCSFTKVVFDCLENRGDVDISITIVDIEYSIDMMI